MNRLSIIGYIGVASLAMPVKLQVNVSAGIASSTRKGTKYPESNVVLYPKLLSNELLGILAFGTSENLCPVLDVERTCDLRYDIIFFPLLLELFLLIDCSKQYKEDIYPENFISIKGKKVQVPKYYQNKFKNEEYEKYEELRRKQKKEHEKRRKDNTTRP